MAGIKIDTFGGIFPRISPRLIPDNAATIAENARLSSGRLEAWREPLQVPDHNNATFVVPTNTRTIYRHRDRAGNGYWLVWTTDVHAVPSPIAEDPWDRLYWTGQTHPRMAIGTEVAGSVNPTYQPSASRKLGVPAPENAPTVSVNNATAAAGASELERAYVFTWVSGLGEEGPPSPASAVVTAKQGATVTLTFTGSVPSYIFNTVGQPAQRRIYRTNANGEFQFVMQVAASATTATDAILDTALGEIIPTIEWEPPPDEVAADHPDGPMRGLTQMPNGILAGFAGRSLFFSEPFIPSAFPKQYSQTVRSEIVGLSSISIGLLVMTKGKPYLVTGSSPASLSVTEIDTNQACVSARSICDMGDVAIYATPDGLAAAGENGVRIITDSLFSRSQWQALNPSSIHGYEHNGRYIFFWQNGAQSGGYALNFRSEQPELVSLNFHAIAGFTDTFEDELYLVTTVGGVTAVRRFDGGTSLNYTWQSKELRVEKPINPGVALIDAEAYPVTFTLFADGVQRHNQSVANGNMFRLPAGYLAKEFQLRVSGNTAINQIIVAENAEELR